MSKTISLINEFSKYKQFNKLKYEYNTKKDTALALCHFTHQELKSHVIPLFSIAITNTGASLMFVIDFL